MNQNNENLHKSSTDPSGSPVSPEPKGRKNKWLWSLLFVAIAACSIWAVSAQAKNFSPRDFLDAFARADWRWLMAAVLAMLGFVFFEACAIRSACRAMHYPISFSSGCSYSAADIYFSAITPSATGGQPACAFLMMRDGIPGTVTTAVLLLTLATYSVAILAIGILLFFLYPTVFFQFGTLSKILIFVGFLLQIGLSFFFFLLLKSERLLERLCRGALHLLGRLRLLRNEEQKQEKLRVQMADYRNCVAMLKGHRLLLFRSFFFNFLQRASQISVTMFVYLARGGQAAYAAKIWAMQSYTVIGSNCVPIPGAMGVSDYLMLDGFRSFLPSEEAVVLSLMSRAISFYSCIVLCGILVLFSFRRRKRKDQTK